jgi:histone acetyltransferase (RNA polymerase elongator complex component)
MLVRRPHREIDGLVVHYGVIASGDQSIECGVARGQVKKALGAICFEREAAGLMDVFPCLVIRGIDDYVDMHKNDYWTSYAAATAAAFAKELLDFLSPDEIHDMVTIVDVTKAGVSLSILLYGHHSEFMKQFQFRKVEQNVSHMRHEYDTARKGISNIYKWDQQDEMNNINLFKNIVSRNSFSSSLLPTTAHSKRI